jgi:hypothetical protein
VIVVSPAAIFYLFSQFTETYLLVESLL